MFMQAKKLWKCPNCKREFSKKGQSHSCVSLSVDDHFKNRPVRLKRIFNLILQDLRKNGPVRVDAVKSAINLGREYHFGMIYVLKDSIKLEFVLNRKIKNRRIKGVQKITGTSYVHTSYLKEHGDVDEELSMWLKEAYFSKKG